MRNLLKRVTLLGDAYEVMRDRFFTREAITNSRASRGSGRQTAR